MLKPLQKENLDSWEKALDDSNLHCYVPQERLEPLFDNSILNQIVNQQIVNRDNISYLTQKSPITNRSLNDSYIWSQILEEINFRGEAVVELGSGTSQVLDLALSFFDFKGSLIKVDYTKWGGINDSILKRPFSVALLAINIVTQTKDIPMSDLIAMNHFWDDLYMGLWSVDAQINYFDFAAHTFDEIDEYWKRAIREKQVYLPQVINLVKRLTDRINPGGYVIMKNYPSGYETHYRQVERVNFTFELSNLVSSTLKNNGLEEIRINLEKLHGPEGSKYPDSFFVLRKL